MQDELEGRRESLGRESNGKKNHKDIALFGETENLLPAGYQPNKGGRLSNSLVGKKKKEDALILP